MLDESNPLKKHESLGILFVLAGLTTFNWYAMKLDETKKVPNSLAFKEFSTYKSIHIYIWRQ